MPLPRPLAAALGLLLAGCVSAPPLVDQAQERRAAHDPAALSRIGAAAQQSGDTVAAADFYGRAASLSPGDADAALGYARALTEQKRPDDAIAALQRALPQTSGDGRVRVADALGKMLVMAHRPGEATQAFRTGLAGAPGAAALLIGLGVALDARDDHPAAQASYRRALAVEPGSFAAGNDLALSEAIGGDTGAALAELEQLRRAADPGSPDGATVESNLALVHAMRGEVGEARALDASIARNGDNAARNVPFYSALAPGSGAGDSSGFAAGAAAPDGAALPAD